MKKNIMIFGIAFVIGLVIYQLIPVKTTNYAEASLANKTKSDVIIESDIIVRVTVKDILPSKWSNPDFQRGEEIPNIIQTDISLTVDEVFKGIPYNDKNIVVIVGQGVIGDVTTIADMYPSFEVNDNYILFLSKDDLRMKNSAEDYYILTGMCQGAFILDKTTPGMEYVTSAKPKNDRIILSDFRNEIASAIESSQ